jgi:tetratricopeptide (TPR) repeat protein
MQSADAAGLKYAEWLIPTTRLLLSQARVDEAVSVHERMLSLDPANPLILNFTTLHFLLAQRPEAALRVAKMASVRFPDLYDRWQGYIRFAARGELTAYREAVDPWLSQALATADPNAVGVSFLVLRCEHRYAEILRVLHHLRTDSLSFAAGVDSQIFDSVGERPVAEYRGWAYLLLKDRPHAREQGREALAFVAHHPDTKWNQFFLQLIAAQGYTFTGQKPEAITAARSSLELMPRSRNAVAWIGVASLAARVYAWNGMEDEALTLLEALADSKPGMQPALIARDPLFTVPLAGNARFQALAARLEGQMQRPLM